MQKNAENTRKNAENVEMPKIAENTEKLDCNYSLLEEANFHPPLQINFLGLIAGGRGGVLSLWRTTSLHNEYGCIIAAFKCIVYISRCLLKNQRIHILSSEYEIKTFSFFKTGGVYPVYLGSGILGARSKPFPYPFPNKRPAGTFLGR